LTFSRCLIGGKDDYDIFKQDVWDWNGGALHFSSHLFYMSFYSAAQKENFSISSIQAYFQAGGVGYPDGTTTNGARIKPWIENQWAPEADSLAQNQNGVDLPCTPPATCNPPGPLNWSTTDIL
jgi:hypothetical protein